MQKKTVWIFNHYAHGTYFNKGGRHYWFAKNLLKKGYEPTIFCASTRHNSDMSVDIPGGTYRLKSVEKIPYVFVKTTKYKNGIERIKNMWNFYKNLYPSTAEYGKEYGKPDVILASSVHPLTLLAGIKIAKKYNVPCICEIRDLWPETIVQYGTLKKNSLVAKLLYKGEKWLYKKADKLIFTIPGGKDYVEEIGLSSSKVRYINNGVDLEEYNKNKEEFIYSDEHLDNPSTFKILYTGSMGVANELTYLVQAADKVQEKGIDNIQFILFGHGSQREKLKEYVQNKGLTNIVFKEKVEKKFIPNILSRSDLNVFTGKHIPLYKYGLSLNKLFDYIASGKPTLSNMESGYDILVKHDCGKSVKGGSVEALVDGILEFYNMDQKEYDQYCENSLVAIQNYDFKILTDKLEAIIIES
ncbi:glycosyltransferase family 4 protein [Psychrobacillus sp. FSL H8-0510]|uniref:glycosyltransferase family 4 protein n=1 Tax=Psychrobacillus sp. FSL H8-0510 TaxID=2921394 RepID=UPI0030F53E98